VGDHLFVSGTTAMAEKGAIVGVGDPYEQTRYVIGVLKKILSSAGFEPADIVRTRLFVTNLARWDDYARAHSEAFDKIRPASSIVQVSRLVDPRLLVELEADAVLGCKLVKSEKLDYGPA
jgi:enamine deaminase RidA (YjgF/YER057c/UK114 family)